jgi:transcriptional regulator GlxA family with amidase domain
MHLWLGFHRGTEIETEGGAGMVREVLVHLRDRGQMQRCQIHEGDSHQEERLDGRLVVLELTVENQLSMSHKARNRNS